MTKTNLNENNYEYILFFQDGFNCGMHVILHARRAAGGKRNLATPEKPEVPLAVTSAEAEYG